MRRKLLFGNWKMNKTIAESKDFALSTKDFISLAKDHNVDLGVAPVYLSLETVRKNSDSYLLVAAQNVHFEDHGAFTGEISIPMLKEIGITWSLVGHSERRTYDNETNEKCNKKIKALIANKMVPLYCVGETLKEFENGDTKKVVKAQVEEGLKDLTKDDVRDLVIAYEPVWSIGTGKNASKEIAEDVCAFIRSILKDMFGLETSENIRILYGGSVKPENVKSYLSCENVDGALVGGASLKVESFENLLKNIL